MHPLESLEKFHYYACNATLDAYPKKHTAQPKSPDTGGGQTAGASSENLPRRSWQEEPTGWPSGERYTAREQSAPYNEEQKNRIHGRSKNDGWNAVNRLFFLTENRTHTRTGYKNLIDYKLNTFIEDELVYLTKIKFSTWQEGGSGQSPELPYTCNR